MLFEAEDIWHRLFHLLPLCAHCGLLIFAYYLAGIEPWIQPVDATH